MAEGDRWLSAGQDIGYFSDGTSDLPVELLDTVLEFPAYRPESPAAFATDLGMAFESITPEHIRFLHLAMFATVPEWVVAFSEASAVVEKFVHRPQIAFASETIDKVAWSIEGPIETDTYPAPSSWRTGVVHGATGRARRIRLFQLGKLTELLFAAVQRDLEDEASSVPTVKLETHASPRSETGGYTEIIGRLAAPEEAAEGEVEEYPWFGQEPFPRGEDA